MMNTPHIKPDGKKIAETILLPGDPLRAKFIAENFLENAVQFNEVRNMFGYTGTYKGKEVSVMGTGMGMPSMGIYSYELMKFFGVKKLMRIGSCGAMQPHMNLYDIVIAQAAATDSNYGSQFNTPGSLPPIADFELLSKAVEEAKNKNFTYHVGNVLSSDIFYNFDETALGRWQKNGILAVEMEAAALYWNAMGLGCQALAIMTVSDHIITKEVTTSDERQTAFTNMMEIALEVAIK